MKAIYLWTSKAAGTSIFKALRNKSDIKIQAGLFKPPDFDSSKFIFTFVRNPWDRTVSVWRYLNTLGKNLFNRVPAAYTEYLKINQSFDEFVYKVIDNDLMFEIKKDKKQWNAVLKHWYPQDKFIEIFSPIKEMNFIGHVENLKTDFAVVCEKIGIKNITLGRYNQTNHKNYPEYYNSDLINIVAKRYARSIDTFKYRF